MLAQRRQEKSHLNRSIHRRHRSQIRASYGKGILPQDRQIVAYLPGDRSPHFQGKRFRQLGFPIQVTLRYQANYQAGQDWYLLEGRRRQETHQGWREYEENERLFHYNGLMTPGEDVRAMRLASHQQQELVELLLVMHSTCVASLKYNWQPQPEPMLPNVWHGYASHNRPAYQDSRELRGTAAQRLNMPIHHLGQHGEEVLQEYLRILWEELWLAPDHPENDSGLWLIESQYCGTSSAPVLRYEDFSQLLGLRLSNPWWYRQDFDPESHNHQFELQRLIPEIWRAAVTESDWRAATTCPSLPLFASGASRLQVVKSPVMELASNAAA